MGENSDKKQRKYWNDHLKDMYLDEEGTYSYKGAHYTVEGDGKAINMRALIVTLLMDAALLATGMVPASGAVDTWYVIIPYTTAVIFSGFLTYYIGRWTYRGPSSLREYIYKKTVLRIPGSALGASIVSLITLVCEAIYLILNGMGKYPKGAILLIICMLITASLGYYLFEFIKKQKWLNSAGEEQ